MSLGVAEGAYEAALRFATTREQFGQAIAHKQAIQFYLADMATEIEALRSLVYRAAWAADSGQPLVRLAAMAKLYGSEVAYRVSNKAVQIHGGSGYVRDFPMERIYRDARAARILEGTSEIQRYVIAADILRERQIEIEP
ncbi:MAG: acyl-CoA dehydrogenase, partial [Chloroflexi bacterium]|nr:acyl-CoA dehydrogenase [Chloroflexota bacterium]